MSILDDLEDLGYNIRLMGDDLRLTYCREGTVDIARVTPLLDAIKIYKKEVVEHIRKQAYFESAFRQATEEVSSKYVSGVIKYIRETHSNLWQQITAAEDQLSEAWLAGIDAEFQEILDEWVDLDLKAIRIFEERESQGNLL